MVVRAINIFGGIAQHHHLRWPQIGSRGLGLLHGMGYQVTTVQAAVSPAPHRNSTGVESSLLHFGHAGFFPVARQHANFHVRVVVQQIDQSQRAGHGDQPLRFGFQSVVHFTDVRRSKTSHVVIVIGKACDGTHFTEDQMVQAARSINFLGGEGRAKNLRPRRGHGL